ncbi:hypothetical protein AB0912_24855 [Streptomyces sp. NPDC007084]|uniref:hypothetical protein n=1 Tax=Streptomyces sp. NPDC007084 TaxID=3154313 RepID=UPI003455B1F1
MDAADACAGLGTGITLTAPTTEGEVMGSLDRRDLLKRGIAAAALVGTGREEFQHAAAALEGAHRCLDSSAVGYFRQRLEAAKRDDGALGAQKTLPLVLGLLSAIEQRARDVKTALRRELLSVAADGAEFAGWLYRDIHQPAVAAFWYDRAMEWAQEADDPAMQGYVLLKKSQMAYDSGDAVRILSLALSGEPDEAARIGTASAKVAQAMKSERTLRVLGEVSQTLDRWRGRPVVREFRQEIHVA